MSLARAAYGRKNAVRPLQALRDGLMAVATFWFLAVFPFDFTQRADLLPRSVQFAFLWVNNDIGALILVIIAVAGLASMVYNSAMFVVISHAESTGHTGVGSPPSGWQA